MKRKRFSTEQIVAVLKQAEMGLPVADLIRQVGITEQTFYRWKRQFGGLESDQVRELKQVVDYAVASHGYSQRRACRVTQQHVRRSASRAHGIREPRSASGCTTRHLARGSGAPVAASVL